MSTCMYCCWLPTRVLYSAASRAAIARGHPRRSASSSLGHPHTPSSSRGQPHNRSTSNVRSSAHNGAGARNGAPRWLSSRSDTLYTVSGGHIEPPKDAQSSLADSDTSLHKQTHTTLADTDASLQTQNHTNLADTDTFLHTQNYSNLTDTSTSTHTQTHSSLAYTDVYTFTQTHTNTDVSPRTHTQTKLGVTDASVHAQTQPDAHTRLADTNASLTTHSHTPLHKEFTRTLNTETHRKDNTNVIDPCTNTTISIHTNRNTNSRSPHTQTDTRTSLNTPTSTNLNRLRNSNASKSSSHLHQKPTIPKLNKFRPLSRSVSAGRLHLSAPTQYSITSEYIIPNDSESASSGRPHSPDEARHSLLTTSGDFDQATAEMSSKRSQDALTPTRKSLSNKKKKVTSKFLDQIPLPEPTPLESIPLPKAPKSTPLEFIPLPKSPPREQEEDSNGSFGDFFILDTTPSNVVFPELPKRGKNNGGASNKFGRNSSKKEHDKKSNQGSNRNSNKRNNKFENPLVNQISDDLVSSSSIADESTRKLNNNVVKDDDIEYVSSSPGKNNRRRKFCRTNNPKASSGTRSANDLAALMDDDEIGIVFEGPGRGRLNEVTVVGTVSGASGSRQGNKTSPGRSSLSTSSSPPSTSNARLCHTRSGQGLKTKATEDEVSSSSAAVVEPKILSAERRDSSPGIEKVNVIDPDVVEMEEQPGCSQDVEVIDVFKDSSSDDSASEDERGELVVENDDFLTLGRLKVKDLTNTEIDIDDETLETRRRLEDLRRWDMTGLGQDIMSGKNIKPTDITFTVLSYNVLAQSLLTDNMSLYKNCDSGNLDWKYRWALLQHEIEGLDPDILLLQEVQASHYHTEYLPWFTFLGFDGLYKKRTGMKADGCAIFYKRSKFSLLEHCSVEYLQPQARDVLDRDNIALIAKLASVKQPRAPPLCVATTHLLYNPRRHDVKLAQTVLLMSEIDRICFEGEEGGRNKYCPILVTGDFNAEPHTTLMEFMKSGRLQYEGLSCKTLARYGSFNRLLDACLIPPSLGLTDRCQHSVLAQGRMMEKMHGPIFRLSDKRKLEESLIKLYHSDRLKNELTGRQPTLGTNGPTSSGWLSHGFNFKSVYHHRTGKNAPEATTHQGSWTTVDYMLYNRVYSHAKAKPVEGNLKLLARYRLLTGPEAERFAPLPSSVCPSDHFPLAAQFLLRR